MAEIVSEVPLNGRPSKGYYVKYMDGQLWKLTPEDWHSKEIARVDNAIRCCAHFFDKQVSVKRRDGCLYVQARDK